VNLIQVLHQIAPEILGIIEQRYAVLRVVYYKAPIGRRALAQELHLPERLIRNELEFLVDSGFVVKSSSGAALSAGGERILLQLSEYIRQMRGLSDLEQELGCRLNLKAVIIVPGNADHDPIVKQDLAKATARYLRRCIKDGDILAVSGGTTLAEVAKSFGQNGVQRNIMVVPARGGLGEDVELQANTIAARLAQGLGGSYRLLHAPDNVEPHLVDTILQEPSIREVVSLCRRAHVLLHGIGTAEEMARRRGLHDDHVMQLIVNGAVGEAFGYYFNDLGEVVYSTASVGIRMEDLAKIPLIVGVGGGKSKAWALLSVIRLGYCDVCITDEGAARKVIQILKSREEM
jgi:central glycolytic genes regulator